MSRLICRLLSSAAVALLVASPSSRAAIEFPPQLITDQDYFTYARHILEQVPQIYGSYGNALLKGRDLEVSLRPYLEREQRLVKQLQADQEYMSFAESRGPLQTFTIESLELKLTPGVGLSAKWDELLKSQNYVQSSAQNIGNREALRTQIKTWAARNIFGFFSGWASLLPREKRNLLSEPDLQKRWELVREALNERPLTDLHTKFRAASYGLPTEWNWSELDAYVESAVQGERQLIVRVEEANPSAGGWILSSEVPDWLGIDDSKILNELRGIQSRAQALYTRPDGQFLSATSVRKLVLREIPPTLAIYRGCVGNDCSSSRSMEWAYAPTDRHWWIDDALTGEHLGYVSGAITQVDQQTSLYIRDVAGPTLRATDIPLILNSFFLIKEHYGAVMMTIAPAEFSSENHVSEHANELRGFNYLRAVTQVFPDQEIRPRLFRNTYNYDDYERHRLVRQIAPTRDTLEKIRVSVIKPLPGSSPSDFWTLLTEAHHTGRVDRLKSSFPSVTDPERLLNILKNLERLPIKEFRERLASEIERQYKPVSRNDLRRHRPLMAEGHLRASDSFSTDDNIRTSVRAIVDRVWSRNESEDETRLLSEHARLLEVHDIMVRAIQSLFERKQGIDGQRFARLWKGGLRFDHLYLRDDDLYWLLDVAPPDGVLWAATNLWRRKGSPIEASAMDVRIFKSLARLLEFPVPPVPENHVYEAVRFLTQFRGIFKNPDVGPRLTFFMHSKGHSQSVVPLAVGYLRDGLTENQAQVEYYLQRAMIDRTVPEEFKGPVDQILNPTQSCAKRLAWW